MDRSFQDRTSRRVQWLDAPAAPEDSVLQELRDALGDHPEVREAWLVNQLITPSDGEAHEVTAIAMAIDPGTEPGSPAAVELVHRLNQVVDPTLKIRNWIFVKDAIRPTTEQHGLKIYARS